MFWPVCFAIDDMLAFYFFLQKKSPYDKINEKKYEKASKKIITSTISPPIFEVSFPTSAVYIFFFWNGQQISFYIVKPI